MGHHRAPTTGHVKAARFKRKDRFLEALSIGVIMFPGASIPEHIADKDGKPGISIWRLGSDCEAPIAANRNLFRTKQITNPAATKLQIED